MTPFRTNFRFWDDLSAASRESVARGFNAIVLAGREHEYVYDVDPVNARVCMVKTIAAAARHGELPRAVGGPAA